MNTLLTSNKMFSSNITQLTNFSQVSSIINLDTPKIYVACLSAYNSGYLRSVYIDATLEPEEIREEIQTMLSNSPVAHLEICEEFAIHDFEGFEGVKIHEYESIDRVCQIAKAIDEHGKPFALYLDYLGFDDLEEAIASFEDNYCGCFDSIEDYVQDYYEQTGQLEAIENAGLNSFCINWKAIAHDWDCSGDFLFLEESADEIHVFNRH